MVKIHTYIIHCTSMDARKQKMEKFVTDLQLSKKIDFTFEFITQLDPTTITAEDIKKISLTKQNTADLFDQLIQNMHANQISNVLKHGFAIEKAATTNADYVLIIEDDVLYGDDIGDQLSNICKDVGEDDFFFLGLPSLKPLDTNVRYTTVSDSYKLYPCCDSYLAKPATFGKIVSSFYPIKYTNNIQLSYVLTQVMKDQIQVKMASPNIFLDGSKFGLYLSSVDPNSKLLFNPDFNRLAQIVYDKNISKEDVERAFDMMKFRNHPDVMHLYALHQINGQEYEKAQTGLENIYQILKQNNCIINGNTEFLKTYMRTFKYTQDLQ